MLTSVRQSIGQSMTDQLRMETHHRMATYCHTIINRDPDQRLDISLLITAAQFGPPHTASICCEHLLKRINREGPIDLGLEHAHLFLERTDLTVAQRRSIQLLEIDLLRSQWDNSTIFNQHKPHLPMQTQPTLNLLYFSYQVLSFRIDIRTNIAKSTLEQH